MATNSGMKARRNFSARSRIGELCVVRTLVPSAGCLGGPNRSTTFSSKIGSKFVKITIAASLGLLIMVQAYSAPPDEEELYYRVARQIAEARMAAAVKSHWSDETGFAMPPVELAQAVEDSDSPEILELKKKYVTAWKVIDDKFAEAYASRQAPLNDKHLKNAAVLRKNIAGAIEAIGHVRGGGSTSAMLLKYAKAQTEWILRQLWNGATAPEVEQEQFLSKLREAVFYYNDTHTPTDPRDAKEFSRGTTLLSKSESPLTPGQRAVVRQAILDYFGD